MLKNMKNHCKRSMGRARKNSRMEYGTQYLRRNMRGIIMALVNGYVRTVKRIRVEEIDIIFPGNLHTLKTISTRANSKTCREIIHTKLWLGDK